MKRILVVLSVLSLLLLVVGPAFAGHKVGHDPKGGSSGPGPGGGSQTPSCEDGKGNNPQGQQNKHCYPGNTSSSNSSGQNASFATEAPKPAGLTVGTAAIMAIGALGALLVARRRWVFRTARR